MNFITIGYLNYKRLMAIKLSEWTGTIELKWPEWSLFNSDRAMLANPLLKLCANIVKFSTLSCSSQCLCIAAAWIFLHPRSSPYTKNSFSWLLYIIVQRNSVHNILIRGCLWQSDRNFGMLKLSLDPWISTKVAYLVV